MSFKCKFCDEASPAHSKPVRLVLETREKTYRERFKTIGEEPYTREVLVDAGGIGSEIVGEAVVCEKCAEDYRTHTK